MGVTSRTKRDAGHRIRKLWRCPKCGQTFVAANLWHSCVNIPVDTHFENAPPRLREGFDAFVRAAEQNGRIVRRPVKTRIALQAYTRFAAVNVRVKDLACHVILDHGRQSPPTLRVEKIGNFYLHAFVLATPDEVDARSRVPGRGLCGRPGSPCAPIQIAMRSRTKHGGTYEAHMDDHRRS